MPSETDLCVRGAQADFEAAGHRGACVSDLHSMCCQIEDMLQSIALGLSQLTQALQVTENRIDRIETWVQAQQTHRDQSVEQESAVPCGVAS